jgi:hypothetical protein
MYGLLLLASWNRSRRGSAGLALVTEPFPPFLMAISGLLLCGLWQLYRNGCTCELRSRANVAIL